MDTDKLMTTNKVAEMIACSVKTVRAKAKNGEIPYKKVGDDYRFKRSDIEIYLDGGQVAEDTTLGAEDVLGTQSSELTEIEEAIKLAEAKARLAEVNQSLLSQEDINIAITSIDEKRKEANALIDKANEAVKKAIAREEESDKSINSKEATHKSKWGDVDSREKDFTERQEKFNAKVDSVEAREVEADAKIAESEDLKRLIKLVILRDCGGDVWYEVAAEINRIAMARNKK